TPSLAFRAVTTLPGPCIMKHLILILCAVLSLTAVVGLKDRISPAQQALSNNLDQSFAPALEEIAKIYESFGRADPRGHWAPTDCRFPRPAVARLSDSEDSSTHGQKLYSVFARHRDAYL